MNKLMVGLLLSLTTLAFPASASDYSGKVTAVVCHTISAVCQIQLSDPHTGAACVPEWSAWKFSFDGSTPVGKNILAILLTAQASKLPVAIGGLSTCSVSNSEDVRHVFLNTP